MTDSIQRKFYQEGRSNNLDDGDPRLRPDDDFSPPPPSGRVFHTDDSNPDDLEYSGVSIRPSTAFSILDHDERYDYQLPYRKITDRSMWKWAQHPIVATISFCVTIYGFFFTETYSFFWCMAMLSALYIGQYTVVKRSRHQKRYNMEWQADAEPTGCFNAYDRYWWLPF